MANQQQPGDSAAGPAPLSPKGAARRRFTRAGAAASGVLLTLQSQPAMATAVCRSPSGYLSGPLQSTRTTTPVTCAGRTPGYWKTHPYWPSPCKANNAFNKIFLCSGTMSNTYGSVSQMGILDPKQWDRDGLGRHLMAAYLNVRSGKSSFQTTQMLNKIWVEWRDSGYYTPTAGVKWTSYDIVDYLKRTMPL